VTVEVALRNIMVNDADVSAEVGSRVYPLILPQGWTSPAITYQRVSGQRTETIGGTPPGRAHPRFQVDVRSRESYADVVRIGNKVRKALDRFVGTENSTRLSITIQQDQDMPDDLEDDKIQIFRRMLEFRVSYDEQT